MIRILSAAIVAVFAVLFASVLSSSADPTPRATAAGGSHQVNALEGCMNQWLFNGVWRVKITSVTPYNDVVGLPGFKVAFEIRNGSTKPASLLSTGAPSRAGNLIFDDENELDGTNTDAIVAYDNVYFKELPPSGGMKYTIPFLFQPKPDTVPKPIKWLVQFDPSKEAADAPRYTTGKPDLRIDLTCNKA